jgi:hypothetical protein
MNQRFDVTFESSVPHRRPALPRRQSFFSRVQRFVGAIAIGILVLAMIVAAVILGSFIAIGVGVLLAVALIVGIVRVMLQRTRP